VLPATRKQRGCQWRLRGTSRRSPGPCRWVSQSWATRLHIRYSQESLLGLLFRRQICWRCWHSNTIADIDVQTNIRICVILQAELWSREGCGRHIIVGNGALSVTYGECQALDLSERSTSPRRNWITVQSCSVSNRGRLS
jgi:hypothetical protein